MYLIISNSVWKIYFLICESVNYWFDPGTIDELISWNINWRGKWFQFEAQKLVNNKSPIKINRSLRFFKSFPHILIEYRACIREVMIVRGVLRRTCTRKQLISCTINSLRQQKRRVKTLLLVYGFANTQRSNLSPLVLPFSSSTIN